MIETIQQLLYFAFYVAVWLGIGALCLRPTQRRSFPIRNSPTFQDVEMKKRRHPWQHEIDLATAICAPLGYVVAVSTHDYEIATVKGDGVQLVIYPHTVSTTRNQHARVRDNGSKDKAKAKLVMAALYKGEGLPKEESDRVHFSCTFSWKGMSINDPVLSQSLQHHQSDFSREIP